MATSMTDLEALEAPSAADVCFGDADHPGTIEFQSICESFARKHHDQQKELQVDNLIDSYSEATHETIRDELGERRFFYLHKYESGSKWEEITNNDQKLKKEFRKQFQNEFDRLTSSSSSSSRKEQREETSHTETSEQLEPEGEYITTDYTIPPPGLLDRQGVLGSTVVYKDVEAPMHVAEGLESTKKEQTQRVYAQIRFRAAAILLLIAALATSWGVYYSRNN